MAGTGEEFGPCPHCGQLHPEEVLLCPTAEKLLPLEGRLLDGKFRFRRMLGEGGMGAVWKAENTLVKKDVALKLMHAQFASDEGVLARFRNEATAAGRIGSEHICDILDLGKSKLGPYIVMEMLVGKDFSNLLAEHGRIPPGLAVLIIREALIGLGAAHAVGIVHRDLKPENIFLHEPKPGKLMVKLMDFGISKFTEGDQAGKTGVGVLMGTPEYMSPEQTEGAAKVDQRTDIWAMGVILYWALAGKNPFVGPTMAATLVNVSTKTQPPLASVAPNMDPNLVAIVDRCLAKNPADRWNTCEELAAALAPYEDRNNGIYVPMSDAGSSATAAPRPGATVASMGPPAARPPRAGAAPTITGRVNPATLGGPNSGPAASPTWSNDAPAVPGPTAPTIGGGDSFGLSDAQLHARPESSMSGGGKGLILLVILLLVGGGGAAAFFFLKDSGSGGDKVASGDDGKSADDDGGDAGDDAEAEGGDDAKAGSGDGANAGSGGAAVAADAGESGAAAAAESGGVAADDGEPGTTAAAADDGAADDAADDGAADDGAADDAADDDGADDGAADGGGEDDGGDDGAAADDDDGGGDGGGDGGNRPKPSSGIDKTKVAKRGGLWVLKPTPSNAVSLKAAQGKCGARRRIDYAGLKQWRLPKPSELSRIGVSSSKYWWTDSGRPSKPGAGKGKVLFKTANYTCVARK